MQEYKFTPAIWIMSALGIGVVSLIGYLLIKNVAGDTAKKIVDETVASTVTEATQTALMHELVKDEVGEFFAAKLKDKIINELGGKIDRISVDISSKVDDKYKHITDELKRDIIEISEKTKELTAEKIVRIEYENTIIKESVDKSAKSINDFINLTQKDLVPPGCIASFYCTLNAPPSGWLVCDGKRITSDASKSADFPADMKYSRLINILSTTGNKVDENVVQLPDLRGMFLRGIDESRKVGDYQEDAIIRHKHPMYGEAQMVGMSIPELEHGKYRNYFTEIRSWAIQAPTPIFKDTEFQGKSNSDYRSFQQTGESETRPKNIGVVWCIKY